MDARGFIRAVYKAATPSVDFDAAKSIDCCKHTILMSVYERILDEYTQNDDEKIDCNLWMLNQGPQLVRG